MKYNWLQSKKSENLDISTPYHDLRKEIQSVLNTPKFAFFSFLTVLPSFFKAGWKMMDFSQKRWFWDILNMISQVGQFRSIHQNLCLFFFSHCTDFRQVLLRLGRQNSILWDWDLYYDIIMYHDQFRLKRYFFHIFTSHDDVMKGSKFI